MKSYSEAGVDIDRGDRFVDFIKSIPSQAVSKGIGGFSAALPLDTLGFKSPVMMTTTDGTGTKLLVARELGIYDTIGIDLVAMNVNDLLVCGARPVVFLDYIACGRIVEERMRQIMQGHCPRVRARQLHSRGGRDRRDARPVWTGRFRPCRIRRWHGGKGSRSSAHPRDQTR
jgi:phosphoribosylaminoimidazole (AIR) synthetase